MLRRRELRSTLYRKMSDILLIQFGISESSARADAIHQGSGGENSQSAAAQHRLSCTLKVIMIEGTGPEFTKFDRKMTIYSGKEHNTGPDTLRLHTRIVTKSEIGLSCASACTKLSL